jgi:hypothetical protein
VGVKGLPVVAEVSGQGGGKLGRQGSGRRVGGVGGVFAQLGDGDAPDDDRLGQGAGIVGEGRGVSIGEPAGGDAEAAADRDLGGLALAVGLLAGQRVGVGVRDDQAIGPGALGCGEVGSALAAACLASRALIRADRSA